MFEKSKIRRYAGMSDRYASLITIPGDIGREQLLLACLPSVRGADGTFVPCDFHYCGSRREGNRYAEIIVEKCPAEFTLSVKFLMLLAPVMSGAQQEEIAKKLYRSSGTSHGLRKESAGFPRPESGEGGPGFVGVVPGSSTWQTIEHVLQSVHTQIADSVEPRFGTTEYFDPMAIKAVGKGGCIQRARVAEKALAGVARASYVVAFRDGISPEALARYPLEGSYPGLGHAVLIVEDPVSGAYFFADPSKEPPYVGPHPGNVLCERLLESESHTLAVPSGIPWPIDRSRMLIDLDLSNRPLLGTSSVLYTGSSRYGARATRFAAWLAGIPHDLRVLANTWR